MVSAGVRSRGWPESGRLAGVDTSTPAVVLKLDRNVMHHGGLGAIRSLGRMGVPVYGVHEGPAAPAASSVYLRGRCFWQPDPADPGMITAGLLQLADRIGRPAVLIVTDDAGAIFLAEHGAQLRTRYLFPEQPAGLPRRLAGKFSLHQLCGELGVPSPRSTVPGSGQAARAFAASVGYPLICKLASPWQAAGGSMRSTSVVTSQQELDRAYRGCAEAGAEAMLQEFIEGGPGSDWFFHGYCDPRGICRPAFTGVKDRSYPAHAGLTSLGRSAPNERLRDRCAGLLHRLGYRGIVDLDLRLDRRDGEYKLLDFNPRLGAQFRVFRDAAGLDVVTAQYLDLTGAAVPDSEPVAGRRLLVENYDPLGALGYWRRGELGLRSWLASVRGADELAWFATDDLRPFGLMCLRMGIRLATRPLGGGARRTPRAGISYRDGRAGGRLARRGREVRATSDSSAAGRPAPFPPLERPEPRRLREGSSA